MHKKNKFWRVNQQIGDDQPPFGKKKFEETGIKDVIHPQIFSLTFLKF